MSQAINNSRPMNANDHARKRWEKTCRKKIGEPDHDNDDHNSNSNSNNKQKSCHNYGKIVNKISKNENQKQNKIKIQNENDSSISSNTPIIYHGLPGDATDADVVQYATKTRNIKNSIRYPFEFFDKNLDESDYPNSDKEFGEVYKFLKKNNISQYCDTITKAGADVETILELSKKDLYEGLVTESDMDKKHFSRFFKIQSHLKSLKNKNNNNQNNNQIQNQIQNNATILESDIPTEWLVTQKKSTPDPQS